MKSFDEIITYCKSKYPNREQIQFAMYYLPYDLISREVPLNFSKKNWDNGLKAMDPVKIKKEIVSLCQAGQQKLDKKMMMASQRILFQVQPLIFMLGNEELAESLDTSFENLGTQFRDIIEIFAAPQQ